MTRVFALALALGAFLVPAVPASADLTEWPTCSLPLSVDQALCSDGRSPNRLVTGPDGGVWFTTYGGQEIGRVSAGGALVLYNLPAIPGVPEHRLRAPHGITVGPDGALWFVEDFGNRIGRVTTSGSFSFIENPGARPQDIALGPDGAFWITESGTNSIGRLTVGGTLTRFPLPPTAKPGNKLMRITAGPDGRMWFAEQIKGAIGAITTAGAITEYRLPAGWNPQSLVAGPDGAVWFTAFGKGVGRITTSGKLRLIPLPGAGAASITVGPDGALWVGEGRASGILRITPGGSITETPLLSGAVVNDIITGPDGAIWFVETARNRIGRLGASAGNGPTVTSITPTGGSTLGGTVVRVRGSRLTGASAVLFGTTPAASFTVESSRLITATAPAGAPGPVRVVVTARRRTSPGTDAGLFTFATDPATIAAPLPTIEPATTLTPARPHVSGSFLVVPVRADGPASFAVSVAIPGVARSSATSPSAVRSLGRATGRVSKAGSRTVRIRLSPSARRALAGARRRRAPLYVAARAKGADQRTSVRQRSDRLR